MRRVQGPAGMPSTHPGMEPSSGAGPDLPPYKGRVTAVCDGIVSSVLSTVRFERTLPSAYEDSVCLERLEPSTSGISGRPLCHIGVRALG